MELLPNLRDKKISLASASPRRRELMGLLGIDFAVAPSVEVNEVYPDSLPAEEVPLFLSRLKAEGYRSIMTPDDLFITADTVVIIDDDVIGKPHDEADAAAMLGRLSGRRHTVVTGVTLSTLDRMESFSVDTAVDFAPLTAEEIAFYVSRFRPLDKAGAYGIQEWIGAIGIKGIEGSFYNVMGLPVHRLWNALRSF
nr:septum formation protein Maf [Bacteroides sp.]